MYPYREMFYTLDDNVKKAIFALCNSNADKALELLTLAREDSIRIYESNSAPYVPDESNLSYERKYRRKLRSKYAIARKVKL